ncbi:MAG: hypothetical protein V7L25_06900 [Nostoc sp.]
MQSDAPLLQSSDAYGGLHQPIAQPLLYLGLRPKRSYAAGFTSPRASEASLGDAPRSLLPRSGTAQTLRCVALREAMP